MAKFRLNFETIAEFKIKILNTKQFQWDEGNILNRGKKEGLTMGTLYAVLPLLDLIWLFLAYSAKNFTTKNVLACHCTVI